MIELVLTVCSLVQRAACRELDAIPRGNAPVTACVFASQSKARTGEHPNFYVQRATCQPAKRVAKS